MPDRARSVGIFGYLTSLISPNGRLERSVGEIDFAFIFHPRNVRDIARKYPWVLLLPERLGIRVFSHLPPILVSPITGLSSKSGRSLRGMQIAVPSTPDLLLRDRCRSQKRILAAVCLAEKLGAKIVGLGALTSTLTNRGRFLVSRGVTCKVTTGHSLSVAVVIETAKKAATARGLCLNRSTIAIVGACGSIGSACARWLAEEGRASLLLHDSREKALDRLKEKLPPSSGFIRTSIRLEAISEADLVIVATNDPRQIIQARHLKPGAVVIDDAQPPNVSAAVAEDRKFLLAWGGLVQIPGIDLHFDIGLVGRHTVFSCLGEIVTLSAHEIYDNYTIGPVELSKAKRLFSLASDIGMSLAPLQAFGIPME